MLETDAIKLPELQGQYQKAFKKKAQDMQCQKQELERLSTVE